MIKDISSWIEKNLNNWPYWPIWIWVFLILLNILARDPISPKPKWIEEINIITLSYLPLIFKYGARFIYISLPLSLLLAIISFFGQDHLWWDMDYTLRQAALRLFAFAAVVGCISQAFWVFGYANNFSNIPRQLDFLLFIVMTLGYGGLLLRNFHNRMMAKR